MKKLFGFLKGFTTPQKPSEKDAKPVSSPDPWKITPGLPILVRGATGLGVYPVDSWKAMSKGRHRKNIADSMEETRVLSPEERERALLFKTMKFCPACGEKLQTNIGFVDYEIKICSGRHFLGYITEDDEGLPILAFKVR
jgi:hypothetical protein